jgi:hypothetical protein
MGLAAVAIAALIVLLVRQRDMRQLEEQRMADRASQSAASGYGGQGSGYGGQGSEYDRPEWEPGGGQPPRPGGGQPPRPGGPPSGPPNRPRP